VGDLNPRCADVDGRQDPDLRAPVALLPLAGYVGHLAEHALPKREDVPPRKGVSERLARRHPRREVRLVDLRDQAFELARHPVEFPQELSGILGRRLALLHERARLQALADLPDPSQQLASERECFSELHLAAGFAAGSASSLRQAIEMPAENGFPTPIDSAR